MLIALATGLATIACQGCVSGDVTYDAATAAPTGQSLGMTLAAPGPLGQGAMNTSSERAAAAMSAGLQDDNAVFLFDSPSSPVTVMARTERPGSFSLTGSGAADLPVAQTNLAWGSSAAMSAVAAEIAANRYGRPEEVVRDMSLGLSIAAPRERTGLSFDVGLAPRVSIRDEGDLSTQRVGGEVRFGQGLNLSDRNGQPEGWYFFVGADGEALVWDNSGRLPSIGDVFDVRLTDQVTVGDLQAGLSIQRAGGELSFSYIRREVKFDDRNRTLKDSEDFAGVTFTMRR